MGYLMIYESITDILYSSIFSSSNFLGKTRLRMTPMTAERPMPEMAKLPEESTAPPNPMVSITEMMITLRVLFISTLFCIKFCTPTLAMVPKSKSMMPPNTACGMLCNKALNFPTMEKQMAVAAAISAGNCVILKPSHHAQESEQLLAAIIQEAFPPEQVAVVTGGNEIHHSLLSQKYDFIFYTGGATAGKKVMEAAARNLTPVCLELGGKNPCIVDGTADIDSAAKRIMWGKLINSGQNCLAPDYVLVQEDKHQELMEKMCMYMNEFYGDNPVAEDSGLSSIINERHFFRLLNLANGNNPANGTVVTPNPAGASYNREALKIKPILLDSPELDAPVMQDEIFGPILPIIPYNTLNVALSIIQEKPEPLALYLFSNDKTTKKRVSESVRYGGGCINDTMLHASSSHLPFGGTGYSGMGNYHGKAGFDTFSHQKAILSRPAKLDTPLRYPPYNEGKRKFITFLLK